MLVYWLVLLVVLYYAVTFNLQRRFVYPIAGSADAMAIAGSEQSKTDAQRFWLETGSGRVEALYLPPIQQGDRSRDGAAPKAPALLFAHGNGELIDEWPQAFEQPRQWGLAVLLVEYPGYGRSEGKPSQRTVTRTMVAAYDWLARHAEIDANRIIGHGRSLGGGAICALSTQRPLAALLLESTFTSIRTFTRRFGLFGPLTRDPYDNLAAVQRYSGPVLIYHGTRDTLVSFSHARRLAAVAADARLEARDCGHNDCERPWSELRRFLADTGLMSPSPGSPEG